MNMSTPPTMSLTAKINALRDKGFSDDEIDQLLASPASSEPVKASPFNMAEMVNNGSSIEEWNKQVDETEKLYINTEAFSVLFIGIGMISVILLVRGFIEFHMAVSIGIMCIVLVFLVQVFSAPKYREKIKFFVKKR
jgi:ABC-type transport system involved in cytochrome bd biosynthesis fused ATPase/permease subunit